MIAVLVESDPVQRLLTPSTTPLARYGPTKGHAWDHELSPDNRAALADVLEPMERVDLVAPAVGCVVVLTGIRLVVVRDGANYRPRTGVRSFALDEDLGLRLGPARHQVIIEAAGKTITVFLRADQFEPAEALVAEARRRMLVG